MKGPKIKPAGYSILIHGPWLGSVSHKSAACLHNDFRWFKTTRVNTICIQYGSSICSLQSAMILTWYCYIDNSSSAIRIRLCTAVVWSTAVMVLECLREYCWEAQWSLDYQSAAFVEKTMTTGLPVSHSLTCDPPGKCAEPITGKLDIGGHTADGFFHGGYRGRNSWERCTLDSAILSQSLRETGTWGIL